MKKAKHLMAGLLAGALVFGGCGSTEEKKPEEKKEEAATPTEAAKPTEKEEEIQDEPEDGPEEEPADEEEDGSLDFLYEQYYDIISGLDEKWDMFQFDDLDGDGFPEVFISSSELDMNDLQQYMIITHSNAGAELNEGLSDGVASAGGYRGTLYYVAGSSIVYERASSAPENNPSDNVYLLDNGHLTLYATGTTETQDGYQGPDDKEHMSWYWNGEEVTPEKYEELLNAETENLSGEALSDIVYVDRETILESISACMQ